jgi:trehalose 2-sulfotransferase
MVNKVAQAFGENATIHGGVMRELAWRAQLYVIFILPRTGSTWLMEMAENSGVLGTPQEWFNEDWIHTDELAMGCRPPRLAATACVDEYLRKTVTDYRSPHGIMGLQLSPYQAQSLCEMLENPRESVDLVTRFYLRRANIVGQAISLFRSVRSGFFHSYQDGTVSRSSLDAVEYDAEAIQSWCEHIVAGEIYYDRLFRQLEIAPACFTYEDIVAKPRDVLAWMANCIDKRLDERSITAESSRLSKLGGKRNEDWEQRFRVEQADYLVGLAQRRPAVYSDFQRDQ